MEDIKSVQSGLWSDPNTWDLGRVPDFGDRVWIMEGHEVVIDTDARCGEEAGYYVSTAYPYRESYGSLILRGVLKASREVNASLDCRGTISCDAVYPDRAGVFDLGNPDDPLPADITFTWYRNNTGFATRGSYYAIGFRGYAADKEPKFYAVSAHYRRRTTYLLQRANPGDTKIYVKDVTGWMPGDKLLLAPIWEEVTNRYPYLQVTPDDWEWVFVDTVNGNEVTLQSPLNKPHGYDDLDLLPAGLVNNFTSNLVFEGGGPDTMLPAGYFLMSRVHAENVVVTYANNPWSGSGACFYCFKCSSAVNEPARIKHSAFHVDASEYPQLLNHVLYFYYDITHSEIEDVAIVASLADGKYVQYGLIGATSGGFDIYFKDVDISIMKEFSTYSFGLGSQVHHLENCRCIGSRMPYYPQGTTGFYAKNCWSIGCGDGWSSRNATPVFEDLHLHAVGYFSNMVRDWQSLGEVRRLWYKPGMVLNENVYRSAPDQTPTSLHYYEEINGAANKLIWFWADGKVWTETDTRSGQGLSVHIWTFETDIPITYKRTFSILEGEPVMVGVYVKRVSGSGGVLKMRTKQGTVLLAEVEVNLEDYPLGEWFFISSGASAHHTGTVEWEFELTGTVPDGDPEIVLSDFQEPFTQDENRIARAVWAQLLSDNNVSGSFGEYVGQLLKSETAFEVWRELLATYTEPGSAAVLLKEIFAKVQGLPEHPASVEDLATLASKSDMDALQAAVVVVKAALLGKLEMRDDGSGNTELVIYNEAGSEVVARFALYDKTGQNKFTTLPETAIVKREPK